MLMFRRTILQIGYLFIPTQASPQEKFTGCSQCINAFFYYFFFFLPQATDTASSCSEALLLNHTPLIQHGLYILRCLELPLFLLATQRSGRDQT